VPLLSPTFFFCCPNCHHPCPFFHFPPFPDYSPFAEFFKNSPHPLNATRRRALPPPFSHCDDHAPGTFVPSFSIPFTISSRRCPGSAGAFWLFSFCEMILPFAYSPHYCFFLRSGGFGGGFRPWQNFLRWSSTSFPQFFPHSTLLGGCVSAFFPLHHDYNTIGVFLALFVPFFPSSLVRSGIAYFSFGHKGRSTFSSHFHFSPQFV